MKKLILLLAILAVGVVEAQTYKSKTTIEETTIGDPSIFGRTFDVTTETRKQVDLVESAESLYASQDIYAGSGEAFSEGFAASLSNVDWNAVSESIARRRESKRKMKIAAGVVSSDNKKISIVKVHLYGLRADYNKAYSKGRVRRAKKLIRHIDIYEEVLSVLYEKQTKKSIKIRKRQAKIDAKIHERQLKIDAIKNN